MVIFFKRGIIVLSVSVFVMACFLGVKVLTRSFPVKNILVSGNYHLEESEIQSAVRASYGNSLLKLSLDELEARLKKKPWIKKVILRKQFPDTIMINVEEAMPRTLLRLDDQMFLVDSEGKVLEKLDDKSTPFLPVLVGIHPQKDRGGILEALKLVETLDEKGFLSQKESVEVLLKPYGLVLNMDGEYIKVGYGKYQEKLQRWKDLEAEIRKKNISVDYVDLRYEKEVIVKPLKKKTKRKDEKNE
jgi:cell division septal protein FtsQ